jgi:predicted negative regulator of RcsB-dependent stress response
MANHLDLEEQEQLDQLKHFWKSYGNLITWILILVFGSIAAWNGYQYWERRQAAQAAAMFEELERAIQSGDSQRMEQSLNEMTSRFGKTTFASQGSLLAAKALTEQSKAEAAKKALKWLVENASDDEYRAIAGLRLASLLASEKAYDGALALLSGSFPKAFQGLVADRRGDIFAAQGRKTDAVAEYQAAYRHFDGVAEYRRLVEVKLNAWGVDPSITQSVETEARK